MVRKVLHQCVICTRYNGQPYNAPNSSPLLQCRIKEGPPFSCIKVDYAGPLYIKGTGTRTGLFCLRAVSSELFIWNWCRYDYEHVYPMFQALHLSKRIPQRSCQIIAKHSSQQVRSWLGSKPIQLLKTTLLSYGLLVL